MGALTGPDRAEARAVLLLQRTGRIGDVGLDPLVARFGSPRAALAAPAGEFARVTGVTGERRHDPELQRRVDDALAWCERSGVSVVHRWSDAYPDVLRAVPFAPGVLFLAGDASLLSREVVTVVGSRKATEYGRRVARDVATLLARHGVVVASGLALGIDGEAHRATLEAGGATVAVLGSGLARPYPRTHTRLFREIAARGLLVSEFLPHDPPLRHHFPQRNRTLAALAKVVVVVEAALESGALNTAGHASDLNRDLLAVPGSIYARNSQGSNQLLERAFPLLGPATVLAHLSAGAAANLPLFPEAPPPEVGAEAQRVWSVLAEAPLHVDEVARAAGVEAGAALVALSLLELGGWARQQAGARFVRSAGS